MVRQPVGARSAVLERLRTKTAGKPLRPRVETYAFTKDNKILAGLYPDGSVGVFGGGVDGDSLETAAKKEYREEGGKTLKSVEKVQGVKPVTKLWKDDPAVHDSESAKHKARREKFSGSKTIFMTGEVGDKAKTVDGSKLKDVKPRTVEELISIQKKSLKNGDEDMQDVKKARLAVLQRLREKTAELIELNVPDESRYRPEFHAHEVGHHRNVLKSRPLAETAHYLPTAGALAAGGLIGAGIAYKRPELAALGTLAESASNAPHLIDEALASRYALGELKGTMTPEEYGEAKKKLIAGWVSHAARPVATGTAASVALAGRLAKSKGLERVGSIGQLAALPVGALGSYLAGRRFHKPGGKTISREELEAQHERLAPDLQLIAADRPLDIGAGYVMRPRSFMRGTVRKVLETPGLNVDPDTVDKSLESGAVLMGAS